MMESLPGSGMTFMHRLAKIKYPAVEGCQKYVVTRSRLDESLGESDPVWFSQYVGKRDSTVVYRSSGTALRCESRDLSTAYTTAGTTGVPRFTSRGNRSSNQGSFSQEYLQPEVTFIDGSNQSGNGRYR